MRTRPIITAILTAMAISLTTLTPAQAATYADPLTQGDLITYNHHAYALSIKPATKTLVTRYGHKVPATYTARIIQSTKTGDKTLYTSKLGYYRTAYLRTKLVSLNTIRDYNITTYAKKVTAYSADYAHQRVSLYMTNYRQKTLRGDVIATANNVDNYIKTTGSLTGIQNNPDIIVISNGFFYYTKNADIRILTNTNDTTNKNYQIIGLDTLDLYQSVYDSTTTGLLSGPVTDITNNS